MITIGAVIERATQKVPHSNGEEQLCEWLEDLDGQLNYEFRIMNFELGAKPQNAADTSNSQFTIHHSQFAPQVRYEYPRDAERPLLIGMPYGRELYVSWLRYKIYEWHDDKLAPQAYAQYEQELGKWRHWYMNKRYSIMYNS